MGYILRERVEFVTFGVAWADDYTDGDVRTWLAADPKGGYTYEKVDSIRYNNSLCRSFIRLWVELTKRGRYCV